METVAEVEDSANPLHARLPNNYAALGTGPPVTGALREPPPGTEAQGGDAGFCGHISSLIPSFIVPAAETDGVEATCDPAAARGVGLEREGELEGSEAPDAAFAAASLDGPQALSSAVARSLAIEEGLVALHATNGAAATAAGAAAEASLPAPDEAAPAEEKGPSASSVWDLRPGSDGQPQHPEEHLGVQQQEQGQEQQAGPPQHAEEELAAQAPAPDAEMLDGKRPVQPDAEAGQPGDASALEHAPGAAAGAPVVPPAAACSRGNLQLVLVSRLELARLVEVEQLLSGYSQAHGIEPPLSVLSGLVVRFHSKGYYMGRLASVQRQGAEGKIVLVMQDGNQSPIPLAGISNSTLVGDDAAWAKQGEQEAAALCAAMQASASGLWTPEQVAVSTWHRRLAKGWHAFVSSTEDDQQQQLPTLLTRLAEGSSIAKILKLVEVADGLYAAPSAAAVSAGSPVVAPPAAPKLAQQAQQQAHAMDVDAPAVEVAAAGGGAGHVAEAAAGSEPAQPLVALGGHLDHAAAAAPAGDPSQQTAMAAAPAHELFGTPTAPNLMGPAAPQPHSAESASLFVPAPAPGTAKPAGGADAVPADVQGQQAAGEERIEAPSLAPPTDPSMAAQTISPAPAKITSPDSVQQPAEHRSGKAAKAAEAGGASGAAQQQVKAERRDKKADRADKRAERAEKEVARKEKADGSKQRRSKSEQPQQQEQRDGKESARQRQRIAWEPQEPAPGDQPLEAHHKAPAAAASHPSQEPQPRSPTTLTITRSLKDGLKLHQADSSLKPAAPAAVKLEEAPPVARGPVALPGGSAAASPAAEQADRLAVREPDGNLTFVVRLGDKGGGGSAAAQHPAVGGAAAAAVGSHSHAAAPLAPSAGSSGAALLGQAQAQQAALLAQLQQLGQLAPALAAGQGGADLLQLPAAVLLSGLQQLLGKPQGALQTQLEAKPVVAGPSPLSLVSPNAVLRAAAATGARCEAGGGGAHRSSSRAAAEERGARGGSRAEHYSRGMEEQFVGDGRQVEMESPDGGELLLAEATVELPGIRSVEDAIKHLERLTRKALPSSARLAAIQRACLRELLIKGLSHAGPPCVYRQAGVVVAQLGSLLLQACRQSDQVAAEYEEYGKEGRVMRLVADLEAEGLVQRLETKRGRVEVLLRVDLLEELAVGASGGSRKRSRQEAAPPPAKLARRDEPSPPLRRPGGGVERGPRLAPPATADVRGSAEYADFWDPVWRYEHLLVRHLRRRGQVPLNELYQDFPMPDIYGPRASWGDFLAFLHQRPHLFDVDPRDLVGAVKGASALLQYKRDLISFLEPRPGMRASLDEVQHDVPMPADTPADVVDEARHNFWGFLTKHYSKEFWLVAPKHYTYHIKTVEVRPFQDPTSHPLAPRMNGVCRYFENGRPASCNKQDACKFSHCSERPLF